MNPANYNGTIKLDETKVVGKPGKPLQTSGNPFADSYFYLSPDIKTMMDSSLHIVEQSSGDNTDLINKIKFVQQQPSAVWLDSIATLAGDPAAGRRSLEGHLDAAVAQQKFFEQKDGQISPMTIVLIVYNLPDRDCAAFASNGQLYQIGKPKSTYAPGQLNGLTDYRTKYLNVIAETIKKKHEYKNLRIVTMLEPDSFPNMITNTKLNPDGPSLIWPELTTADGTTYCDTLLTYKEGGLAEGLGVYGRGLQLAIEELYSAGTYSNTPNNIYTYLDIAHAGWLGWDASEGKNFDKTNLKRGVDGYLKLIAGANTDGISGFKKVRGFASNTAGYTPTEEPLISNLEKDRTLLQNFYEWNQGVDEVSYIDAFNARMKSQIAIYSKDYAFTPGFIIDTARNGWGKANRPKANAGLVRGTDENKRVDGRNHRGHWCNVDAAGIGEVSKASPDQTRPHLDAFFWMKPPGESDGNSFDASQFPKGSAAYNALDAVDKAVVDSASDPKYAGKSLDTMCVAGSHRDGYATRGVVTKPIDELAPPAGGWFHKQYLMMIKNAYPELGKSDYTPK